MNRLGQRQQCSMRRALWIAAALVSTVALTGCMEDEHKSMSAALAGPTGSSQTAIKNTEAASNKAPTLSGSPARAWNAGMTYQFQPAAFDPDGDELSFSIDN